MKPYIAPKKLTDRKNIPQEIWWSMVRYGLSEAHCLRTADLTRPFVYDRYFGFFYVPATKHPAAMSLLLAWHHGCADPFDLPKSVAPSFDSEALADRYLESISGTCYRSSVSKGITYTWTRQSLNVFESDLFSPIKYLSNR